MKRIIMLALTICLLIPLNLKASGIVLKKVPVGEKVSPTEVVEDCDLKLNYVVTDEDSTTFSVKYTGKKDEKNVEVGGFLKLPAYFAWYHIIYYDETGNIIDEKYDGDFYGKITVEHEKSEYIKYYTIYLYPAIQRKTLEISGEMDTGKINKDNYTQVKYKKYSIFNIFKINLKFKKLDEEDILLLVVIAYTLFTLVDFVLSFVIKKSSTDDKIIKDIHDITGYGDKNSIDIGYMNGYYSHINNYQVAFILELANNGYIKITEGEYNTLVLEKTSKKPNFKENDKYFEYIYEDIFSKKDTIKMSKAINIIEADFTYINNAIIKKNEQPVNVKRSKMKYFILSIIEFGLVIALMLLTNSRYFGIVSGFLSGIATFSSVIPGLVFFGMFKLMTMLIGEKDKRSFTKLFAIVFTFVLGIYVSNQAHENVYYFSIVMSLIYICAFINKLSKNNNLRDNNIAKYVKYLDSIDIDNITNIKDILPYLYTLNININRLYDVKGIKDPNWFTSYTTKTNIIEKFSAYTTQTIYPINKTRLMTKYSNEDLKVQNKKVIDMMHSYEENDLQDK